MQRMMPDAPAAIVVLVRDLLFASRIRSAAAAKHVAVHMLRTPSELTAAGGNRLIVDLNQPGALEAAVAWKQRTGGRVVGFIAHVDTAGIQAARGAGIDQVLPRSRFAERLPELLE